MAPLDGKTWERQVETWLRIRYRGTGNLVVVPDEHGGDLGLEAFTRDGLAYQCYSPERHETLQARYEGQRDKITADLGKLKKYAKKLAVMLDGVKLRRWILVTPKHDSHKLWLHAGRKGEEVRKWKLPFVDENDFHVHIETIKDFESERAYLLSDEPILDVATLTPAPDDTEAWMSDTKNNELLANLHTKLGRVGLVGDDLSDAVGEHVSDYLLGESILDALQDDVPEVWTKVQRARRAMESGLSAKTLTAESPERALQDTRRRLEARIESVGNLGVDVRDGVVDGTVAGWLAQCNLKLRGRHES